MSINPPHPCPAPHCGRLTRRRGRCGQCVAKSEQARGTATARGYGAQWSEYSRAWLARFPFCGMRNDGAFHVEHSYCARLGRRVRAEVTDHIRSMKRGGARFDPTNHQSLCRACNSRKAVAVEGGFGR